VLRKQLVETIFKAVTDQIEYKTVNSWSHT